MYKAMIFDLDGTIIDTLPDITKAINVSLEECGFPYSYTEEEATYLIGNGTYVFMKRALKEQGSEDNIAKLKPAYLKHYEEYQCDTSLPFPGVVDFLEKAKEKGIRLYVVTNKPDRLAKTIVETKIGKGVFSRIEGQVDGIPHKPDPTVSNKLIEEEKLDKSSILWIGDSLVDLKTASNVGVDCALVSYGYGHLSGQEKAKYQINSINELLSLL